LQQISDINSRGFLISLKARIVAGPTYDGAGTQKVSAIVAVAGFHPSRRFDIALASDGQGNTLVILPSVISASGGGFSYTPFGSPVLVTGTDYHLYQLSYEPMTQTAALFVDGVKVVTGYPGSQITSGVTANNFGLAFGSLDDATANFALAELDSGQLTPIRAVYITNGGANTVSVIDPSTNRITATVTVGRNPLRAAITPDGSSVYVTNATSQTVSVISTGTNSVVATIPVGLSPVWVAITPDGKHAYVTNALSNSVSVIDTSSNTVTATVLVGADPVDISITPDGMHAYVTNAGSNSISVIDTSSNTLTATVPVGAVPVNAAIIIQ
jgi:YVTN family beta-propeller protein